MASIANFLYFPDSWASLSVDPGYVVFVGLTASRALQRMASWYLNDDEFSKNFITAHLLTPFQSCGKGHTFSRVQNSCRLPAIAGTLATVAGDFSPKK